MRAHSLTLPPVDLAALIGAVDPFTVLVIRHAKDHLATAASAPPHVYFDPWDDPHRLAVARGQPLRRTLSAHQHERRAVHADAEGLVVSAEPLPTLGTHLSGPARCIAAAPSFRALFPRLPPSLYRIKPLSPTPRPLRLSNALVCATVTPVTHPAKKKAGTPSRTPAWKRHTTELSCIAIPRRADPLQLHPRVYTPPGSL
jgi:hypothetical protein